MMLKVKKKEQVSRDQSRMPNLSFLSSVVEGTEGIYEAHAPDSLYTNFIRGKMLSFLSSSALSFVALLHGICI